MASKGFVAFHRCDFYLLNLNILNTSQFSFWRFLIAIMRFQKGPYAGCFMFHRTQFQHELHASQSTIYGWIRKLQKIGLISSTEHRDVYRVTNYHRYLIGTGASVEGKAYDFSKLESDASPEIVLQNIGVKKEIIDLLLQKNVNLQPEHIRQDFPLINHSSSIEYNNTTRKDLEDYLSENDIKF